MDSRKIWIRIIEANLSELIGFKAYSFSLNFFQSYYVDILLSYLRSDISELDLLVNKLENQDPTEPLPEQDPDFEIPLSVLQGLARSRLEIRNRIVTRATLHRLNPETVSSPLWKGECLFVSARAAGKLHLLDEQRAFYLKASYFFNIAGAHNKSLKSLHNAYAIEGHLHPEKRLTLEYQTVLNKALELNNLEVAGISALDISRELQILGSRNLAMHYASDSLKYLKGARGTVHFGLALCHQAQLYAEENRFHDFEQTIEEASLCDFPEVHEAIKKLRNYFQDTQLKSSSENCTLSWYDRDLGGAYLKWNLGAIEERLISFLASGPANTYQICDHLFSTELSRLGYEIVINRVKNLLNRIRKKAPNLIVRENRLYCLSGISRNLKPRESFEP